MDVIKVSEVIKLSFENFYGAETLCRSCNAREIGYILLGRGTQTEKGVLNVN